MKMKYISAKEHSKKMDKRQKKHETVRISTVEEFALMWEYNEEQKAINRGI